MNFYCHITRSLFFGISLFLEFPFKQKISIAWFSRSSHISDSLSKSHHGIYKYDWSSFASKPKVQHMLCQTTYCNLSFACLHFYLILLAPVRWYVSGKGCQLISYQILFSVTPIDPPLTSFKEEQNCNCLHCPGKGSVTPERTDLLPALIISDFLPSSNKNSSSVCVENSKKHSFSHIFCLGFLLSILRRFTELEMWKIAQFWKTEPRKCYCFSVTWEVVNPLSQLHT